MKRRAVPLRVSGGGVASLREGGGILQSAGTGRFGSQNDGRRMRADGFSCALGMMLAVLFGLAFSPRRVLCICGRLPPSRRGAILRNNAPSPVTLYAFAPSLI